MGETFAGRMGASLFARHRSARTHHREPARLRSARHLSSRSIPNACASLRERLDRNRLTTPLFDTAAFTRHLEAGYTAMIARYDAGLPPDHIHVTADQG